MAICSITILEKEKDRFNLDEFNTNAPTIIVASLTTVLKKRYLPSHIILGKESGLKKPSMVLLEQIQTIIIGFAQKQLRLEYRLKKMNK